MSKREKKAEAAVAEKKALTPVKKTLTPVKKDEPVVKAAEPVVVEPVKTEPVVEPVKTEPVKLERPAMPLEFCMDKTEWESNIACYSPENRVCDSCAATAKEAFDACVARAEYLKTIGKAGKTKSTNKAPKAPKTPKAPRADGKMLQTVFIDNMIKESKTIPEMIAALAEYDYEGSAKLAKGRINRHVDAIVKGTYCKAAEVFPYIGYLLKETTSTNPAASPAA